MWTAGVKPQPVVRDSDLPLDEKGRLKATAELAWEGTPDAFAAGDNAAVPDLTKPGESTAPNAQHAVRQAKVLADNIVATLRGEPLKPYRHAYAGSVASLGLHKGVAQVYGVKVRGWAACPCSPTAEAGPLKGPDVSDRSRLEAPRSPWLSLT